MQKWERSQNSQDVKILVRYVTFKRWFKCHIRQQLYTGKGFRQGKRDPKRAGKIPLFSHLVI